MERKMVHYRPARLLILSATVSAIISTLGAANMLAAAANDQDDSVRSAEKAKNWQDMMSEKFRETWNALWQNKEAKSQSSIARASVDLREQPDSYIVRLTLPDRNLEKLEVTWSGDTLQIVTPAEGKTSGYEQHIRLDGVPADAKPAVERKQEDNLVVITVPKEPAAAMKPSPTPAPWFITPDDWDRDVLGQMEQMRREMDRIFNHAFAEFRGMGQFKEFFNQSRFGSSVDIREEIDKYIVRAYLPDRDMTNVNVTVEHETLKLEAKAENSEERQGDRMIFSQRSEYSQLLMLPGPVQADKMTVERKENMLVVTLPKAQSS
jgi:HSP20 family molecular chaperone IbpA